MSKVKCGKWSYNCGTLNFALNKFTITFRVILVELARAVSTDRYTKISSSTIHVKFTCKTILLEGKCILK